MKINGTNQPNVNPYQKQLHRQTPIRSEHQKKADQLQISDQAKKMQEFNGVHPAREQHVNAIKQEVDAGQYKVEAEQVAKKMLTFWRK
ncbi:flagellar biosynthesis anti-sigma factor FlgM [Amphibacillus jilinensis]|uniref:flagellar biosynthesis anti-sigma factor FlgM n=1 Tax=Amphibacillus jilinensis TaxID=1216008 RepID=UPI0002F8E9F7|nr:flagellar biosynthesis anti-sigma factor FlgM [Amphibacillus jilinensis]